MALIRPQIIQPRVVEIGRLHKGSRKRTNQHGKEIFGEDLDYFRFEPSMRLRELPAVNPSVESLYHQLANAYCELGEKPRTLRIRFAYPIPEENFACENEVWKSVKGVDRCVRRCDGASCTLHITERGTLSKEPIPCAAAAELNRCPAGCVPTGRLRFFLPDLNYPGVVLLTTHSIHDIGEIRANLEAYANWDLTKIPFRLCRTEKTITRTDEQGNVFPLKKWLCHLEIDPEFGLLLQRSTYVRYRAELISKSDTLSLPDTVTIDTTAEQLTPETFEANSFVNSTPSATNPNRELLKRIGQITGHTSKQIAQILEDNYPGRTSGSLNDLEVRTIVDAMCVLAATSAMDEATAQTAFSSWLGQQHPEMGNEELARGWMSQVTL